MTFSGDRLFVNAQTSGALLTVERLDERNQPLAGFAKADSLGFCGNATAVELRWLAASLGQLAGRPVKFRFHLDRGDLYAFWFTADPGGESGGCRGAVCG